MKKCIVGILAHVDAGKTTLAESLLYTCGVIHKTGRVDHGDAFLDNGDMERKRGITIFSKQARIHYKDVDITLLDTPGHVDFSAEMERTLQVLDAAILVIDGSDGVQGDVYTLWRLLKRYEVPVFLFVNKMDQPGTDREKVLAELQKKLDGNIVATGGLLQADTGKQERETELEHIAMCSEALMEEYLETGKLSAESIADTVAERRMFPCFFWIGIETMGNHRTAGWTECLSAGTGISGRVRSQSLQDRQRCRRNPADVSESHRWSTAGQNARRERQKRCR